MTLAIVVGLITSVTSLLTAVTALLHSVETRSQCATSADPPPKPRVM